MNTSAKNAAKHLNIWPGLSLNLRPNAPNAAHHSRRSRCPRSAPAVAAGTIHLHARPVRVQREPVRWGNMKTLTKTIGNTDDITGVTLEERARLVLATLGKTPDEIRKAFRRVAKRYHPDKKRGDSLKFKVINEAYQLLAKGQISKRPLLADDELVMLITGRRVASLLNRQKEWEEHERWHRDKFYGVGVI